MPAFEGFRHLRTLTLATVHALMREILDKKVVETCRRLLRRSLSIRERCSTVCKVSELTQEEAGHLAICDYT